MNPQVTTNDTWGIIYESSSYNHDIWGAIYEPSIDTWGVIYDLAEYSPMLAGSDAQNGSQFRKLDDFRMH